MKCPKCSYVREAHDNIVPDWQCPKCGVVYAKFKATQNKRIKLTLTSGQEIFFSEIKLHDAILQDRLGELRQSIDQNFRGFSTGIGAIGSLEDVVTTKLVTGVIDGVVSGSMATKGAAQLQEAAALYQRILNTASFVHVSAIENIRYPQIELWRTLKGRNAATAGLSHIQSKFVIVKIEDSEVVISWDKVETYQYLD